MEGVLSVYLSLSLSLSYMTRMYPPPQQGMHAQSIEGVLSVYLSLSLSLSPAWNGFVLAALAECV